VENDRPGEGDVITPVEFCQSVWPCPEKLITRAWPAAGCQLPFAPETGKPSVTLERGAAELEAPAVPGSAKIARPGGTPLEESVETDDPSEGRAEEVDEKLVVAGALAPVLVVVLVVETEGVVKWAVEPA